MTLRLYFAAIALVALMLPFVGVHTGNYAIAATIEPTITPLPCFPLVDLIGPMDSLDMTGATDSTKALQDAINNLESNVAAGAIAGGSTANYGGCIAIPPGVLSIGSSMTTTPDILIQCTTVTGGPCLSLVGAGTQNTTILQTSTTSNVFDGCPTASGGFNSAGATSPGYTPNMYLNPNCPPPSSANAQNGLLFANLTIKYSSQAQPSSTCSNTSTCGIAPSVWSFPNINGLILQDVAVINGDNCIDAGFANFVKVVGPGAGNGPGSNTEFQCSGDFFAAHGGQGTIIIDGVSWKGGRGTGTGTSPISQGVFMDFTDLNASRYLASANSTVTTITNSDLEGAAWGFLNFADANTVITDTTISGTLCDGFTFACYAFFTVPGYSMNIGSSQHLSIDDTRWMTSWSYGLYLDGGFYTGAQGGAALSVGGNNLLAGSNLRDTGSAITYLANRDLSMQYAGTGLPFPATPWPTVAPGGFSSSDASAIQVVLNPASGEGVASYACQVVELQANDNVRSMVSRIPASCSSNQAANATAGPTSPPYQVTTTYAANPSYGFLEFREWPNARSMVAPGPINGGIPSLVESGANADSYTIFTSQNIEPGPIPYPWMTAGPTSPCGSTPALLQTALSSVGYSKAVYCQIGFLSYGAAAKLTNNQRGIQIRGLNMTSDNGACVWIEPGAGRQMSVANNYMGTGCAFPLAFPSPMSSPPVDYSFLANDMSNAGTSSFVPPQPMVNQPPAAFSTSKPGGGSNSLSGQISGNRGISLINASGSSYFNSFPVVSFSIPSTSSGSTWYNVSPYYCTINAINGSTTSTASTTISGVSVSSFISSFMLPPQGGFSYSFTGGSVSVVATCAG